MLLKWNAFTLHHKVPFITFPSYFLHIIFLFNPFNLLLKYFNIFQLVNDRMHQ